MMQLTVELSDAFNIKAFEVMLGLKHNSVCIINVMWVLLWRQPLVWLFILCKLLDYKS